ncbi:hypothetical protein EXIGLDRAFT_751254 [Exidia glandulosa HHB12029]|uniref:Uncharacterized protein n=1 Tax=Exidia glandulosa HHB12029 TaxID=1314781 RepID=A0A165FNL5_EXIGL|nr:hypothetical protein EXIGLDRAFT_751254 [Exidia glandulosa HHB12029]
MADPVGLVSLGVGGIRGLLGHREAVRRRRRAIKTLATEVDAAYTALVLAQHRGDTRIIYDEVLAPLIEEGVVFLEGVRTRKHSANLQKRWIRPHTDSQTAQALVKRFQTAASEIELKVIALNVDLARQEISRITVSATVTPAPDSGRLLVAQSLILSCFFSCGEASVTPQRHE